MEATESGLWLCEYCDHAPYHSDKLLARHMERVHTEDAIALFNRDMTYRQLVRKASRIAKVVCVVTSFTYDDAYNACYDSLIDLLIAGQPITNRNVRRGAYRALIPARITVACKDCNGGETTMESCNTCNSTGKRTVNAETSLDEMMLETDDADDDDVWTATHAYGMPEAQALANESLLEIATAKFDIEEPMLWLDLDINGLHPQPVLMLGYDALLANTEQALDDYQFANRKADERRGRPRKQPA